MIEVKVFTGFAGIEVDVNGHAETSDAACAATTILCATLMWLEDKHLGRENEDRAVTPGKCNVKFPPDHWERVSVIIDAFTLLRHNYPNDVSISLGAAGG